MPSVSLKTTSACLSFAVALGASFSVHAAGLGNLTVLSALGQPLRAEIEVVSPPPEDPTQISVRLAAPEYYERAGVQYSSALEGLRFRVDRRSSGQTMIEVSSSKPMDEPYVDMLVQIESPSGALIRRFVFLLEITFAIKARVTGSMR